MRESTRFILITTFVGLLVAAFYIPDRPTVPPRPSRHEFADYAAELLLHDLMFKGFALYFFRRIPAFSSPLAPLRHPYAYRYVYSLMICCWGTYRIARHVARDVQTLKGALQSGERAA